jgi:hypothetical protein
MTIMPKTEAMKIYRDIHMSDYTKLPFTDKESYIAWRKVWRDAYAELSANIRLLKPLRKSKRDTFDPNAQATVASMRNTASKMMEQRAESKKKAASQYIKVNRVSKDDLVDAFAYATATLHA